MKKYLYLLLGALVLITACKKDNDKAKEPLAVTSFWPNSGNAGTIVTITGKGFAKEASDNEVTFNGTAAEVMDVRDSALIVLSPKNGTTGKLTITAEGKTIEAGMYIYQALSLRSASPTNGSAGANISIRGEGFSSLSAPAKVTVNGKEAQVTSITDTLLVASVPEAAGSGPIRVIVDGKEVTGPQFTFQNIASIKPAKGGKGTHVTINGEGFSTTAADNYVEFNGKPAEVVSATGGQLVAVAPDGVATGAITVVINGQRTVGTVFTVIPPPVLKAVAPLSGPTGTSVTIDGENFSTETDEVTVMFNGKPAITETTADKKMIVKVPAGAGQGIITVNVNDQQTAGPEFTEQNLGVAQLLPDNGLAGTAITIKGIGFSTNLADNIVDFNGVPAIVTSATSTELKVTAPTGVSTGIVTVKANNLTAKGPEFKRAGVITLAGGPSSGEFEWVYGMTSDKQGNIYAVDNNMVKKITPDGTISVFAGSPAGGYVDGIGTAARFSLPVGITIDDDGNLYVADRFNNKVRKITPAGNVTTMASLTFTPLSVTMGPSGSVYVGAWYGGVYQIAANGVTTKPSGASNESPEAVTTDATGNIYYTSDYDYSTVFRIAGSTKSTYAGSYAGFTDGAYTSALFRRPVGVTYDKSTGAIYVGDNNTIRKLENGQVTTIIGRNDGTQLSGFVDGSFETARFNDITSMHVDKDGNLFVSERNNKTIRKIFFR